MRVAVATGNAHKVCEIASILDFDGWDFVARSDLGDFPEPQETGETFLDNARIKARDLRERVGGAVIADDSGLEVDALGGHPGVFSSRYAGKDGDDEANNALLLHELDGVPLERRTARFKSVLVFISQAGEETFAQGVVEGRIGFAPRGAEGFGYDPLFLPDAYGGEKTMAELSLAEKNAISHRGQALRSLFDKLS